MNTMNTEKRGEGRGVGDEGGGGKGGGGRVREGRKEGG